MTPLTPLARIRYQALADDITHQMRIKGLPRRMRYWLRWNLRHLQAALAIPTPRKSNAAP